MTGRVRLEERRNRSSRTSAPGISALQLCSPKEGAREMKIVEIIKGPRWFWYQKRVGERYSVKQDKDKTRWCVIPDQSWGVYTIRKEDCKEIKAPQGELNLDAPRLPKCCYTIGPCRFRKYDARKNYVCGRGRTN